MIADTYDDADRKMLAAPKERAAATYRAAHAPTLVASPSASSDYTYRASLREDDNLLLAAHAFERVIDEWPGAVREIHGRLFDPRGLSSLPPGETSALGADVVKALEESSSWPELRIASAAHRAVTAKATYDLADVVAQALELSTRPVNSTTAYRTPEEIQRQISFLEQVGTPDAKKIAADLQQDKVRSEARRTALRQSLEKALANGSLRAAVEQVVKDAQKGAEAATVLRGWGLAPDPATGEDPVDQALVQALLEMPHLLAILRLVGRMVRAADQSAPEALGDAPIEPCGVTLGGAVNDVLASEWALMEVAEDLILRRLLEDRALVTERHGYEPRQEGDLVVLVDRSGSMGGERIQWARALGMAAAFRAFRDGRRVRLGLFGGIGDLRVEKLVPGDPKSLAACVKLLGTPTGGGTATGWALANVPVDGLRDPDYLVITDGEWDRLDAKTLKKIKGPKNDRRLFAVVIGTNLPIPEATRCWHLAGGLGTGAAADILGEVQHA